MKFENSLISKIMCYREKMKVDGKLSKKFIGAITVELLRKELMKKGFNVSNRDVFIDGVSNELDLLVLKNRERAKENLLYNSKQVIIVFEIKFRGIFSEEDIKNINKVFNSVKKIDKKIKCVYLTISENVRHRFYSEEKKLGDSPCFLFKRNTGLERAIKRNELKITGDWDKLIKLLNKIK